MKQAPFDITPNPRFLFHSLKHREAFNHLIYGVRERKGFVQLTGEVGAGKTTLCRAFLEQLDGKFSTALILNPVLNADELMRAIATEFGLHVKGFDRLETVAAISDFLLKQTLAGKQKVVSARKYALQCVDSLMQYGGFGMHNLGQFQRVRWHSALS